MLQVFDVVRHVFWNDSMFDRKLLPSEAALEKCLYTIADLSTMNSKERIAVFSDCGIDELLFPVFLRSVQHLTSLHGPGSIGGNYLLHRHLSARQWNPYGYNSPLLGYPTVNSEPFRERCAVGVTCQDDPLEVTHSLTLSDTAVHYNGLLNQGATCYLNSLLQALFHISEFRSIIYQMPTKDEVEELQKSDPPTSKSIPYALQRLFCLLQISSRAIGTTELTESFGWGAADSFIQHDVHELTRVLLDNLEKKLCAQNNADNSAAHVGGNNSKNAIHELFNGILESFVRVDEVGYYGAREEPFYDLQLVVKNTKDIYASLDIFFQVEVLDGKNKYCLETSSGKSYHRAEKGVRLKSSPPIMLLHLARFDYDIECGETKIFSRWDYYNTLDLSRYMPHVPSTETHYTLCSVLVHSGSNTGFGHYFCFLKCSGQWYKFNDETVQSASLQEVFGANFGGHTINYWGSEVPCTTNAYMLVYVRTSQLDTLLRPIGPGDVPQHVIAQLQKEQQDERRLQKEKTEDHLYGRFHLIDTPDLVHHEELLTARRPSVKLPSQKTLRLLLDEEALPALTLHADGGCLAPSASEQRLFWYSASLFNSERVRLSTLVTPGMKVGDMLDGSGECCVLQTTENNISMINMEEGEESSEYQLFHHKLYDPMQLKVFLLGSCVVKRSPKADPRPSIERMERCVREMLSVLPDDSQVLYNHHLGGGHSGNSVLAHSHNNRLPKTNSGEALRIEAAAAAAVPPSAAASLCMSQKETEALLSSSSIPCSSPLPLRGNPPGKLTVLRENDPSGFLSCETLQSGDILVWRLPYSDDEKENVFYPTIASFQHFLRHCIPVTIKLNLAPHFPTLVTTELANDLSYEQLQRYVARLIGEPRNYDRIRFTRHNPETELPYFMKGKKKDRATLTALLTPSSNRINTLSKCLYYEYCKFSVTEIENAHSLQFKLYSDNVKPVSSHWILMPREAPITARNLFSTCVREIGSELLAAATARPPLKHGSMANNTTNNNNNNNNNSIIGGGEQEGSEETTTREQFLHDIAAIKPEEAWQELRLVDVWRGRIYNVFDREHSLVFEHQTFEESAEYRIERIPTPVPGVPLTEQFLVQVCHFTMIRQRKDPVETHSEPFSLYVGSSSSELPGEFLLRVSQKLEMNFAAVVDWKLCLVKESRVVQAQADVPLALQLSEFCGRDWYLPNQKEPLKAAFIGLEHAPAKRTTKREEKVVILN